MILPVSDVVYDLFHSRRAQSEARGEKRFPICYRMLSHDGTQLQPRDAGGDVQPCPRLAA
ncbi:hypothetical protein FHX11_002225 [Rhizobium sp. BK602]|nr:hypothetical protein [Rhizobium sp. BK602]